MYTSMHRERERALEVVKGCERRKKNEITADRMQRSLLLLFDMDKSIKEQSGM